MLSVRPSFYCFLGILSAFSFANYAQSQNIEGTHTRNYSEEVRNTELILLNLSVLEQTKQNQQAFSDAIDSIIKAGEKAHQLSPFTVTNKTVLPASNNRNDYFSVGPYWWPDKKKKSGLPWIRKDGQKNPATSGSATDKEQFNGLIKATHALALAYYFSDDKKYAKRAEKLISVFFIDANTKMNPHANYAQSIPGKYSGRGIGIIDFREMVKLLDAMTLMQEEFSDETKVLMDEWLTIFMGWLIESPNGQDEIKAKNNHGTYYDVLLASLSSYLQMNDITRYVINNTKARMNSQITDKGAQPLEIERTRPFHYSSFNLIAFTSMAKISNNMGEDLINYPSQSQSKILNAYRYLFSDFENTKKWKGSQEEALRLSHTVGLTMLLSTLVDNEKDKQMFTTTLRSILEAQPEQVSTQIYVCAPLFYYQISSTLDTKGSTTRCIY